MQKRSTWFSGAKFVVKQNGKTFVQTTDESGIVTISGLTEGDVMFECSKEGYSTITGISKLKYEGSIPLNSGSSSNISFSKNILVPLPRLKAKLNGYVYFRNSNNIHEPAKNKDVVLKFFIDHSSMPDHEIFLYKNNVFKTKTNNSGFFELNNVPELSEFSVQVLDLYKTETVDGVTVNVPLKISESTTFTTEREGVNTTIGRILADN
jgi:hypothetical protein